MTERSCSTVACSKHFVIPPRLPFQDGHGIAPRDRRTLRAALFGEHGLDFAHVDVAPEAGFIFFQRQRHVPAFAGLARPLRRRLATPALEAEPLHIQDAALALVVGEVAGGLNTELRHEHGPVRLVIHRKLLFRHMYFGELRAAVFHGKADGFAFRGHVGLFRLRGRKWGREGRFYDLPREKVDEDSHSYLRKSSRLFTGSMTTPRP